MPINSQRDVILLRQDDGQLKLLLADEIRPWTAGHPFGSSQAEHYWIHVGEEGGKLYPTFCMPRESLFFECEGLERLDIDDFEIDVDCENRVTVNALAPAYGPR
jgi:hypothetical protein